MDIFTSVVRIKGNDKHKVVSVKSDALVHSGEWREFSKVLSRIYVSTPIEIGDIVCKNILNTGVNIVATKNIMS